MNISIVCKVIIPIDDNITTIRLIEFHFENGTDNDDDDDDACEIDR